MADKLKFLFETSIWLLLLFKVGPVKCQDKQCISTSGIPYECKPLNECNEILRSLVRWPKPIPEEVKKTLRGLVCGYEGSNPKMCCRSTTTRPISKHPNLHLLAGKTCGYSIGERIIGGSEASLNEYPWMALLAYENMSGKIDYRCGGSIINKRYVLTAAHCIMGNLVGVRLGEHDLKMVSDCVTYFNITVCAPPIQDLRIEEITVHDKYNKKNVAHDIALIRLDNDINLEPQNVMPVCLPIYEDLVNRKLDGRKVVVTGWGSSDLSKFKASPKLLKVTLDIMSNEECKEKYQSSNINLEGNKTDHITENKFCTNTKGKDSCRGDSGGPAVLAAIYENRLRYIQYGIVSYGSAICADGIPGVYTNISKYMEWILDHIKP